MFEICLYYTITDSGILFTRTGVKPFKCSLCDYASRSKSNLKAHLNRHNTDKSHLCDLCGKKFKSKCTLKSHKLMHSADGEPLFIVSLIRSVIYRAAEDVPIYKYLPHENFTRYSSYVNCLSYELKNVHEHDRRKTSSG